MTAKEFLMKYSSVANYMPVEAECGKKAKGEDGEDESMEEMKEKMEYLNLFIKDLYGAIDNLYSATYKAQEDMYNHAKTGHLPPMSPGQLANAISVLGMDGDYEVAKRTIFASKANVIEIKFPVKDEEAK